MSYNDRNFLGVRDSYTGNIHDTDPTAQARVIINALVDWQMFEEQRQNRADATRNGYKVFYERPTEKKDRQIIRGDVVFQVKRPGGVGTNSIYGESITGTLADDGKPFVMSTLNSAGFFDPDNRVFNLLRTGELSPESYAQFITSHFQIIGIANAYWNYDDGFLQDENKMDGFTVQTSGIAPANAGWKGMPAGKLVVARAPIHDKLHLYYPSINPKYTGHRSPNSIFMSLEPYDPDAEFNMDLLFKRHAHKFPSCIGYEFDDENFDYLPLSYDIFDYDMSIEGYHRALYATIYSSLALYDSLIDIYKLDEVDPAWVGPINGLHVQKGLLDAQSKIQKGTKRALLNETDKLINRRLHMGTLIVMESVWFPIYTKNYTCNAAGINQAIHMRNTVGQASNALFTIHHNMLKNLQESIIGISITSALPGGRFDIQLGLGRQVA